MCRGRVLVVDDNPEIRSLVCDALVGADYDVRAATNGRVALQVVDAFVPDVLIVDIEMPEMDGRQLVSVLRARGDVSFAIILMSAGVHEPASPARRFLRKPFELEDLLEAVGDFVSSAPELERRTVA